MWRREPSITELIRQLDRYTERKDWDQLTREERLNLLQKGEWDAVKEQAQWCADDFTWVARNYFWITNNEGQDVLLDLWQAQYLILQCWYDLKSAGKPQKIFVLKGRQVGASVLVEAMIAWSTIFFPNTEALVVSVDQDHSSYLFGIMLHIYDHLPWWLKPEIASREEKDGLIFDRRDPEQRALKPGLNSKIAVQWSTQASGVGQGRKILSFHGSELTDWYQPRAQKIIDGDLLHAIKDTPRSFAFIETTGKNSGCYSHRLWRRCEKLMASGEAEWYPLFIPFFFEPSRKRTVTVEWVAKKPELAMRERVRNEWVKCGECGRYRAAAQYGASLVGTKCMSCKTGTFGQVVLSDEQLYWKEVKRRNAEETDSESYKDHLIELASTAEESWQLQGLAVFDVKCQEMVSATIRDPATWPGIKVGYYDQQGRFHGLDGSRPTLDGDGRSTYYCYLDGCQTNHMADLDQFNVTIWEEPQEGYAYCIGVDIAEGIGQDYSVIFVNKLGRFGQPDEQVATLRDNRMETLDVAFYANLMGLKYNEALLCMEYEGIGKGACDVARIIYQYPNLYRWLHMDSTNVASNKWHWYTKPDTRQKLWQTMRKWVKSGSFIIRSKNLLAEMQDFQKDEDDSKSAGHSDGGHDDELFCLPGGTWVTTSEGQKKIEDVKVGDLALTHKGRYMPVIATGSKIEPKKLYEVRAYGRPILHLTGNHAMYLWKKYRQTHAPLDVPIVKHKIRRRITNTRVVCWNKFKDPSWISVDSATEDLRKYATCSAVDNLVIDVPYVEMIDYCPEDSSILCCDGKVGFAKGRGQNAQANVTNKIPTDKNFMRLLGYYLAEGGRGPHNLSFASHLREKPIRDWLQGYLKSIGLHSGVRYHSPQGAIIWTSSVVIRAFFESFEQKDTKRLPNWTRFLPHDKQKEILVGYLLGDGSFRRASGAIQAVTISTEAAFQLFQMSLRVGWPVGLRTRPAQECGNYDPWVLEWSGFVGEDIKKHIEPELLECKRPTSRKRVSTNNKVRIHEGFQLGQIISVSPVEFSGPVYDLTVAEDHSFIANGTVVSNSAMIALYCAHQSDADERGVIKVPLVEERVAAPRFQMICKSCGKEWGAANPEFNSQCQFCFSHEVIGKPLENHDPRATVGEVGFNQDGSIILSSGKGVNYSPDRLTADML